MLKAKLFQSRRFVLRVIRQITEVQLYLETQKQNEFIERLEKIHPYSKYGNAMCGSVWDGLMADQIMEEEEARLPTEKDKILLGLPEQ